jgi:hypothetical protein
VSVVARKLQDSLIEQCGYHVPCTTEVRGLCRARDVKSRTQLRAGSLERDLVA